MDKVTLDEALFFKRASLFAISYAAQGVLGLAKLIDHAPEHLKDEILKGFLHSYEDQILASFRDIEPLVVHLPFLRGIVELRNKKPRLEGSEDLRDIANLLASSHLQLEMVSIIEIQGHLQGCRESLQNLSWPCDKDSNA